MCNQVHKEEQAEVQKYVATLKIYSTILKALPSLICILLAGPWSDVHGRKALIVFSTFGCVISNLIFTINAYFFYELKAEFLLLEVRQNDIISVDHMTSYKTFSVFAILHRRNRRYDTLKVLSGQGEYLYLFEVTGY